MSSTSIRSKRTSAGSASSWEDREYYASDYFEQLYQWAEQLIRDGLAYVCSLNGEQIRQYRGTLTEPGKPSPDRDRPIEENIDLFRRMRAGEFPDGKYTLRAKIDMASPNVNMRDPVLYRILHAEHHRTGDKWCIYPMYDYAHGQSDSIEGVTHSICTLEFENHRPLYDWCLKALEHLSPAADRVCPLEPDLHADEQAASCWSWWRRSTSAAGTIRGCRPSAACAAAATRPRRSARSASGSAWRSTTASSKWTCSRIASARISIDRAPRVMAVLKPLQGRARELSRRIRSRRWTRSTIRKTRRPASRKVPFSRELYIEQDDFREDPPKEFFRLAPGREVRLRYGYVIRCVSAVKDPASGEITELRCTYDPATRGGNTPDGRKIKSTIHWVSAAHAADAEIRLYEHLFTKESPEDVPEGTDYKVNLNPNSLTVVKTAKLEPSLAAAAPGSRFQFERLGYFCADAKDSRPGLRSSTAPFRSAIRGRRSKRSRAASNVAEIEPPNFAASGYHAQRAVLTFVATRAARA